MVNYKCYTIEWHLSIIIDLLQPIPKIKKKYNEEVF